MSAELEREPFQFGDEFLQYRIHSLLGRGGHAFVYAGQHRYMERPVAIKVIPAPPEMNSDVYKRARLEAKILSQLEHPNVVKIYDAGVTDEGAIYIVMEMLQGRTLRDCLKQVGPLTVPETLHVGIQIAEAVQLAHAQNAIHRDLKPENVFVLPGNVVKVLDFGITKLLGGSTMTTQPNLIRGTPQYMSPEHMEGRPVTAQSDIYALGSVLYELLAAMAPALIGLEEVSSYAIGYSQIHRVPPRLDEVASHVPRYVARVFQRMLAKDASERHASMAEVSAELRSLQSRFGSENKSESGCLRELWQASRYGEIEADSHGVHSATTAVGDVVLTNQATAVAERPGTNGPAGTELLSSAISTPAPDSTRTAAPLSTTQAEALAERLKARPLGSRHSQSGPAPVTIAPRATREPFYSLPFLVLAIAAGGALGYGALIALRHPQGSAAPSVSTEPSSTPSTLPLVMSSRTTESQSAAAPADPSPVEQPAANAAAASDVTRTEPTNLETPSAKATAASVPTVRDSKAESSRQPPSHSTPVVSASEPSVRVKWLENPAPKASASTKSAKSPKNKDKLIFGPDDLNW